MSVRDRDSQDRIGFAYGGLRQGLSWRASKCYGLPKSVQNTIHRTPGPAAHRVALLVPRPYTYVSVLLLLTWAMVFVGFAHEQASLGQDFPRIENVDPSNLPLGRKCESWSEWWDVVREGLEPPCHRVDNKPKVLYEGGDMDSMCYGCVCSLAKDGALLPAYAGSFGHTHYCDEFATDEKTAKTWGMAAAMLVTAINQILKRTIKGTAHHLKAHTLEEEMASKSIRVFFCQLANTAVLILLLTSKVGPFTAIPGAHYGNINPEWYAAIGAPMVSTMIFQVRHETATKTFFDDLGMICFSHMPWLLVVA